MNNYSICYVNFRPSLSYRALHGQLVTEINSNNIDDLPIKVLKWINTIAKKEECAIRLLVDKKKPLLDMAYDHVNMIYVFHMSKATYDAIRSNPKFKKYISNLIKKIMNEIKN